MDKSLLYFLAKIIAVIASISILLPADADVTLTVISALSFVCIFVAEILLDRLPGKNRYIMITIIATVAACFALGLNIYYPIIIISLVHLLDITMESRIFYYIFSLVLVLSVFIFDPSITSFMITGTILTMLFFCRIVIARLKFFSEIIGKQKETIIELNKKITDIRSLTKTLKYTVSIEERNRIAARIHDQLGHGISGSIIMLEASMLIMKNDPDKATASIQKAIVNLREGVDEIRASLRDERAEHSMIGINEITAMLEEFKVSYNKSALLKTSGDLDNISLTVWQCIHDNMKECLTNVLKHSNATEFQLCIDVFKKIIKVEYKDNGKSADSFEKGLGLEAIEERTIGEKGRCFFNKSENGFCVTNIFTY